MVKSVGSGMPCKGRYGWKGMERTCAFTSFIARLNVVGQWSSLAHLLLARQQMTCSIHNKEDRLSHALAES